MAVSVGTAEVTVTGDDGLDGSAHAARPKIEAPRRRDAARDTTLRNVILEPSRKRTDGN